MQFGPTNHDIIYNIKKMTTGLATERRYRLCNQKLLFMALLRVAKIAELQFYANIKRQSCKARGQWLTYHTVTSLAVERSMVSSYFIICRTQVQGHQVDEVYKPAIHGVINCL